VGYLFISYKWVKDQHSHQPGAKEDFAAVNTQKLVKHFILLGTGLAFVLISSRVLVGSVSELAVRWEVPDDIIAATLVAFGTSLPELVTAIAGVIKGQKELVLGNIIGADILNVLFVVGASNVVTALPIEKSFFYIHLPVMVGVLALFRVFIFVSGDHFRRWMGLPFLMIYVGYIYFQYA
jgi:cation:H+ antiporter